MTSDKSGLALNFLYLGARYFRKSVSVLLMVESLSKSKSASACCLAGGGGGSAASFVLVPLLSLVSPLSPLSIKFWRGSGNVSVTRVRLLLLVLAATGILSLDVHASCKVGVLQCRP